MNMFKFCLNLVPRVSLPSQDLSLPVEVNKQPQDLLLKGSPPSSHVEGSLVLPSVAALSYVPSSLVLP